jgi:hypothetical protein
MTDARGGAGFPSKPFTRLLAGELGADGLERDGPPKARVLGGIHDTHATFA